MPQDDGRHEVEIEVGTGRAAKVAIDGVNLARHIGAFDLTVDAREPVARLVLDIPVQSYAVAGEMKVALGNGVEHLLTHLGWTPPAPAVVLPDPDQPVERDPVSPPPSSG